MSILKALKDLIRKMGGSTHAGNIAEAIRDIPTGGSAEVPPEVTNAIETGGMGWTDEDETIHQIDEKYIPSNAVVIRGALTEDELGDFTFTPITQFDKTASEVLEDVTNGINYVLLIQYEGDVIGYYPYQIHSIYPSVNQIDFSIMDFGINVIYNNGQWSVLVGE